MPTHHFLTSWVQFESLFERLSQIFENIAVNVMLRLKVIGKVDSIDVEVITQTFCPHHDFTWVIFF